VLLTEVKLLPKVKVEAVASAEADDRGASAAGLVLAVCTRPTSGGELDAILDRLSTNILRESPESATSLAVSEEQAGGRYIDRLSDASREGLRCQLTMRFCDLVDSTAPAFTTSKGEA
jgi:hypothetical protein